MSLDFGFVYTAFLGLFSALPNTLIITVVSVLAGLVIGIITALARIYNVPVLSQISHGYVTFIRGTPMLMHLLLIYFSLPLLIDAGTKHFGWSQQSKDVPYMVFALISFSITSGAYMSEVVRSGIQSVNKGQIEAAYAVGMTTWQVLRRIVFPQAFVVSLPNLTNSVIGMLHGSTLAFTVSVTEIQAQAEILASTNWKYLEVYIAAALLFWGLTVLIERISGFVEKKINVFNGGRAS
ncbi:cysteine ABC transporter permease [Paenibacillus jamilae]|uniref:Cysteine ABC transporter permease n=1 Tax=Paenibacillus jamilae TaxID=114136 RepID=A0ACC4ZZQ5_9BACL|nr:MULTISPECIES: amino acid ABC transporter permease [Paenibacillus]AUO09058.1 amino acid ABC transporter permease [Paenibacillus sp. lzh-N1]KTS84550.1 cysteine ABC transporter permease [Paenibacillus jamilae]